MLNLAGERTFNVIRLRENIKLGQRIEAFAVDAMQDGQWRQIAAATSIGANRLIRLPQNITAQKVRLRITQSPVCIALSDFGLYKEPGHLSAPLINRNKEGVVSISTDAPVSAIHYTTDGSEPTASAPVYRQPFALPDGGIVKALAVDGKQKGLVTTVQLGLSKADWKVTATTGKAELAVDDNSNTIWNTLADNKSTVFTPAELTIDLGKSQIIKAFTYLPRQDKQIAGIVDQYAFYISSNGTEWEQVTTGEFSNIQANPLEQTVPLKRPVTAHYIRFKALHVINGNGATAAEIGVIGDK